VAEKEPIAAPVFQTKSAYATSILRQALAEGRYVAGERLLATKLARDLGLSTTPVREALRQLASDGLVEIAPHRGVRVVDIPLVDLSDVYVARAIVEPAAARLAAEHIGPDQIARLRRVHAEFIKTASARQPDVARLRSLNEEFHFVIYSSTESPLLRRMICAAWAASPEDTFGVLSLKKARDDHGELIGALAAGNGARAERLMREHIEAAGEALRRFKKRSRKKNPTQ
jgi:DNA-binding GntR family transcriptional regulator